MQAFSRMARWSVCFLGFLTMVGCTGGAAGDPSDDLGDLVVIATSPGNGVSLELADASDLFNHLNNPALQNPGSITIQFSTSLNPASVLNADPLDPQGTTANVRFFFFDRNGGPFDPQQPTVPGVNPPGANVLVSATTQVATTGRANDTIIITPTGVNAANPLPEGQYSVRVSPGVTATDGDPMRGRQYFFFFRVGPDTQAPVVIETSPAPGEQNVDPTSEIRLTMSETIQASTVNSQNLLVQYQPQGAAQPINIPGQWFTDGGNGPGNNLVTVQLDQNGIPGTTGTSPRNGVDLVFIPDVDAFPTNMLAETAGCPNSADPPEKGNKGLPLGQTITVTIVTTGLSVSDTAGIGIPTGSPLTTFSFQTSAKPDNNFPPGNTGALYYSDSEGVGVIDANINRTTFQNPPARLPNTVVMNSGNTAVLRVPVNEIVDVQSDQRPWTALYTFGCPGGAGAAFWPMVYALSRDGTVTVIDSSQMVPIGRFSTPSPGGIGLTAVTQNNGLAAISNFSANTVTVFSIADVRHFTGSTLPAVQVSNNPAAPGLFELVQAGNSQIILSEDDFAAVFPNQRPDLTSPPGPPVIGTVNVGVSPADISITGLPNAHGTPGFPCFGPVWFPDVIVAVLNTQEGTADFTELTNLNLADALEPDLRGVTLASTPTGIGWTPFGGGSYFAAITSIGGSVELFQTGNFALRPSVLPNGASQVTPNKIISSLGGLDQPSAVQWITNGTGFPGSNGYRLSWLIAETGQNRLQMVGLQQIFPALFVVANANQTSGGDTDGKGPVAIAGDPAAGAFIPCGPRFTTYYTANAGSGKVFTGAYSGATIGQVISVGGVRRIVSWWSR